MSFSEVERSWVRWGGVGIGLERLGEVGEVWRVWVRFGEVWRGWVRLGKVE